jgi:hypothetical protein
MGQIDLFAPAAAGEIKKAKLTPKAPAQFTRPWRATFPLRLSIHDERPTLAGPAVRAAPFVEQFESSCVITGDFCTAACGYFSKEDPARTAVIARCGIRHRAARSERGQGNNAR